MYIMLLNSSLFIVTALIMVLLSHKIANFRLKCKHPELLGSNALRSSPAFLVRRLGLYLGTMIGTFAVWENISEATQAASSFSEGLTGVVLVESGLGLLSLLVFMFIALRSADWLILSEIDNDLAVNSNNVAVGVTESAILLGTGFVAYGSLLGEGHIASSWVFFIIGQISFVMVSYLMEYIIHPSHNAKTQIKKGDLPSGLIVASMVIVTSIFVKNGIAGDFYGFSRDIPYFAKMMAVQMSIFFTYLFLLEPLLLKAMKLKPFELNVAIIRTGLQLGVGISIVFNVSL
jgi:hypothetical protein